MSQGQIETQIQQPANKYGALWVSHSSMGDFLKCPRLYYLHNIYRTPRGRKINLASPYLSLGQAVHETIEGLAKLKVAERFIRPLEPVFLENWNKVSGKAGGFKISDQEADFKERAHQMVLRVEQNPGPLAARTLLLKNSASSTLPNFYISPEENIILCGKVDWIEYIEADNSIRIIDFKTGKYEESADSLQLPIYLLLANQLQKRRVSGAAYWYLANNNEVSPVALPDAMQSKERVMSVAMLMKQAKLANAFMCPQNGCRDCYPYEKIAKGQAEFVGIGGYNQEMYLI